MAHPQKRKRSIPKRQGKAARRSALKRLLRINEALAESSPWPRDGETVYGGCFVNGEYCSGSATVRNGSFSITLSPHSEVG